MKTKILVAGATGNLGTRIVRELLKNRADVRMVVRSETSSEKIESYKALGAEVYLCNNYNAAELRMACRDVTCVVSCLAGLREVIIDAQKALLDAAVAEKVPRFIPSDFSLDFTKFHPGENRNLDWRREFHAYLDQADIRATTIFNGAFADMLTNEMPLVLVKQKMILYWGNPEFKWHFTNMDNTAAYTAQAALDPSTPRYLRIAGDLISPRTVREVASNVFGVKFRLFRPGGKRLLGFLIKVAKKFDSGKNELYPAWQGMQYMHNMIDPRAELASIDNDRYTGIRWTTVKDILTKYRAETTA